jgi:hypothetical protein
MHCRNAILPLAKELPMQRTSTWRRFALALALACAILAPSADPAIAQEPPAARGDELFVRTWRDPLVAAAEPPAGAIGPVESVRVEFTVPVTSGHPNQVIAVTDAAGEPVAGSVSQEGGSTFVFTPDQPLAPGEHTATAFNVATDTSMVAPYVWSFTLGE